jgi:hypothetical protein
VSLVAVERETVDHEGVAEEVEVLAGAADAVGASEPEGVFEVAVDGFGVIASGVEPRTVLLESDQAGFTCGAFTPPVPMSSDRAKRCAWKARTSFRHAQAGDPSFLGEVLPTRQRSATRVEFLSQSSCEIERAASRLVATGVAL